MVCGVWEGFVIFSLQGKGAVLENKKGDSGGCAIP